MTADLTNNIPTTDDTPPAIIEKSRRMVVFMFYALLCTYTAYGLW